MRRQNFATRELCAIPSLDLLEPRHLLAAAVWDGGGGDDNWQNPLNWNRNGADVLPQNGDDVVINSGTGVTFGSGSVTLASLTTDRPLSLQGGTLGVSGAFSVNGGALTYTGGNLNASPTLTHSSLHLNGGTSNVDFIARANTTLVGRLRAGQSIWVQGGGAGHATLSTAQNAENEGVIRLESISNNWTSQIVTHADGFTNRSAGMIRALAGSHGARDISGHLINEGSIDAAANTLLSIRGVYEAAGGTATGSYFVVDAAVRVTVSRASPTTIILGGNNTLATDLLPGHELWVRGGAAGNATLYTAEGVVNRGVIRLESSYNNWTSQLVPHANGFVNSPEGVINARVGSTGARTISGFLINQGLVNGGDGTLLVITGTYHADGGHLTGSYFLIDSSVHILRSPVKASTIILGGNNTLATDLLPGYELWVRGGAAGNATLYTAAGVVNRSIIRLESSYNSWTSQLLPHANGFVNSPEGVINARAGSFGPRTIRGLFINQGLVNGGDNTVLVITGTYHADGGHLTGSHFLIDTSIHVLRSPTTPSTIILGGNNRLSTDLLPGYELWVRGGADGHATLSTAEGVANRGVIRLESSYNNWASQLLTHDDGFVNAPEGVINARAGSSGSRTISGFFINQGLVNGGDGTVLVITGTYHADGGHLTDSCVVIDSSIYILRSPATPSTIILGGKNGLDSDVLPGYELWIRGGASGHAVLYAAEGVVNRGVIRLESSYNNWTSQLVTSPSGFVNGPGGRIEPRIGSSGPCVISGHLINEGTVLIPVGAVLTITGTLTQASTGELHFEINHPGAAGLINVDGTANLAGALRMSYLDSFTPICSQSFTFVTATTIVGRFDTVSTPAPPQGLQFVDLYENNQVRVVASSIADINRDGMTNSDDFFLYLVGFFDDEGDFNGDGMTNTQDFFAFLDAFFNAC